MLLMDNGHFACDFEEIFFLYNEQRTNFQRKQLPNSTAVAEYASKPHVVVKLQSQVFSSFHSRSMIFGSTFGRNYSEYSKTSAIYTKLTDKMVAAEPGEHYRTGTTTTSVLDLASTAPPSSTATASGTARTRRTTPPSPSPSLRVSHQAMTLLRSVLSSPSVRAVDNVIQSC